MQLPNIRKLVGAKFAESAGSSPPDSDLGNVMINILVAVTRARNQNVAELMNWYEVAGVTAKWE
jgi:hypothetical protein